MRTDDEWVDEVVQNMEDKSEKKQAQNQEAPEESWTPLELSSELTEEIKRHEKNLENLTKELEELKKSTPEALSTPTIEEVAEIMEEQGKPLPPEVEEAIRASFTKMFTVGMSTGGNAISMVVYEYIGKGQKDFSSLEKEELVGILQKVQDFLEVAISKDLLSAERRLSNEQSNSNETENYNESTVKETGSTNRAKSESQ